MRRNKPSRVKDLPVRELSEHPLLEEYGQQAAKTTVGMAQTIVTMGERLTCQHASVNSLLGLLMRDTERTA